MHQVHGPCCTLGLAGWVVWGCGPASSLKTKMGHGVAPLCIAGLDGGLQCSRAMGSAAHWGACWVGDKGVGTCLWTPVKLGHGTAPLSIAV